MERVSFFDPETEETVEFAIEEETTLNGIHYLLVSEGTGEEDARAYIMKEIDTKDGESVYAMVEEDTEFEALAKVFAELADEETDLVF